MWTSPFGIIMPEKSTYFWSYFRGSLPPDALLTHQPLDPFPATVVPPLAQVSMDARAAIGRQTRRMDLSDRAHQAFIGLLPLTG
jgi:hypothetical protein